MKDGEGAGYGLCLLVMDVDGADEHIDDDVDSEGAAGV